MAVDNGLVDAVVVELEKRSALRSFEQAYRSARKVLSAEDVNSIIFSVDRELAQRARQREFRRRLSSAHSVLTAQELAEIYAPFGGAPEGDHQ